ncbi:aminotransferase class I/II-fold pyridoxal phosphate-dependent enzyme [Nevskia ramosa]|uniref:aminotransferase class I/II-fold pyridoxal phosphate-dependent enzyme n=1 Tax=Nevskia ramosa TaxID=64002 RepID=UPI00235564AF|nr:8-amino-7-oxononanoate synthase [Nevskia ramosa]
MNAPVVGPSLLDVRLSHELERLRAADLYRQRRVIDGSHGVRLSVGGKSCISFCSNDYLGLASDPRVAEAGRAALTRVGTGSGAAALISGYNAEHARLEEELADYCGRERVLLFSSGWAANLGLLRALFGKDDTLICDELNHASLIDGARLSGARYVRAPHGDIAAIEAALIEAKERGGEIGIVSDSIFSMDGDEAEVPTLARLAKRSGATLIVDDAHGFGVQPAPGVRYPGADAPEVYVATLGKSLGASGAFVAGSEALIEFLIQRARTWVFSTAPPPAIAAAARAALAIIRSEPDHQAQLARNIARFRAGIAALGDGLPFQLMASTTPIQPLIVGDAGRAMALSRALFERGYWVAAIRPPTVPAGTSRLRVTLSAAHDEVQIDGLIEAIGSCRLPPDTRR